LEGRDKEAARSLGIEQLRDQKIHVSTNLESHVFTAYIFWKEFPDLKMLQSEYPKVLSCLPLFFFVFGRICGLLVEFITGETLLCTGENLY